ncbi:alpha-1,4-glucan--maltose-1-phosphate maltosyltransferase [Lacisediminihabitans profunda]|uniref:Alpha-1,4-glucan:maltose-1-phosphate maltosyltransferase n=1 Tax=Lacisediminihabitans profunda TaxID=2594790 RepID=A0A5C8UPB4_9MICO|nr:alpha-1,4-glucan--maltose-1-phosphate maltosyltransferase [Lacisediminihabitans profunda]TXN30093.1 alpha-1,4-glucan--maltose-1-phosphate maltosyltransferase [Lacisediminihabitans profunda]
MGRIPIRALSPQQPENNWPAKAFVGEVVPFEATVFKEGHDVLGVDLLLTGPDGVQSKHRMVEVGKGLDRWQAHALLDVQGTWVYRVQAWNDEWATWLHNAEIKVPAGIDVSLMLLMGSRLLARAAKADPENKVLKDAAKVIASKSVAPLLRLAAATDPRVTEEIEKQPLATLVTKSAPLEVRVERTRAGAGSWYEFFPRSEGAKKAKNGTWTSGTFRTAARRLPAVAGMGFDVIYLPPIHPIGVSFRKGPNNTLNPTPADPGSPWAIGSKEGGHDAIHPDLGTVVDFTTFVDTARKSGLEVAIDLALQCSPDHPWVTEHPEWFTTLPDGTIAYAENPPKKYQDIYPLNFDNDPIGIREEVLRIVKHWIGLGVSIFRVDNPHTKPLQFWEWLLHEVNTEFPDVVFLAEAFTRPAMMYSLGQVGFQQSYTYFTWRNTKLELEEFLTGLSHELSDFFRPNLFVNTPDILTEYLQFGGPAAYKIRAAIAATASPSWGVYAGYELYENVARPGSEENIDNEKYEYKSRDFAKAEAEGHSLAPYITRLNTIRAEHPALRQLRNLDVHWSDDDSILVYSKYLDGRFTRSGRGDALIIVANVDPHSVRETTVHLDPTRFGLEPGEEFEVTDLITKQKFSWGTDNYVRLDAFTEPVHILRVELPRGK